MTTPTPHPVHFTLIETLWLLRRLRLIRDTIHNDMLLVEERVRSGHNGDLATAHHILGGEEAIVGGMVGKLWTSMGETGPPDLAPRKGK